MALGGTLHSAVDLRARLNTVCSHIFSFCVASTCNGVGGRARVSTGGPPHREGHYISADPHVTQTDDTHMTPRDNPHETRARRPG